MKNIGDADRVIRVIVGLILLSLLIFLKGNIRFIGLIGLIPILTALTGICPLYSLLRIGTAGKKT